ncbi:MAG: hypothetical protein A3G93_08420 [Nitrospinae bacterium RIFCSPLOWO2_12_FULL_45_22]|nr:MAG: hypothetical protein A3G93_08420 [Nitrospinae bacterium RIFCSPLOWO2_12_FULL_45_22]
MRLITETTNPKSAELADKVGALLNDLVLVNTERMSLTGVSLGSWLETLPTGNLATDRVEKMGRIWVKHWPEKSFEVGGAPVSVGSESTDSLVSMEAMLSPDRRAILERARAIRRKIGPVPWKISDILRQMDEENE